MAKNQTVKIRPQLLQDDRDSFAALKNITDYAPSNKDLTAAKIQALQDDMVEKDETEVQALAAHDSARDDATDSEWAFHNAVLGMKDQVKAQYGADSNELQAVGLTKKSEFKKPSRAAKPSASIAEEEVSARSFKKYAIRAAVSDPVLELASIVMPHGCFIICPNDFGCW